MTRQARRLAKLECRTAAPVNGQVIFYFGADVEGFRTEFADIGAIMAPV